MAKLYFKNSKGEQRPIADINSWDEIFDEMHKHVDKCNEANREKGCREFQWYYTRCWYDKDDDMTTFDIGSHTEFFIAEGNWINEKTED